ncbi:MAG: 50S ribosomal protein L21 [Gammaproteobacteria bacterium]|nr:50S ribosomal protein L21 [Gammaproteobacteria bacterium]
MYAVIRTGGKQYRVSEGDKLDIETLAAAPGSDVELSEVLMLGHGETVDIGSPLLEGASVTVRVIEHGRHPKIKIVKFKRRKHYRRQMGHRQNFTRIEITRINKGN